VLFAGSGKTLNTDGKKFGSVQRDRQVNALPRRETGHAHHDAQHLNQRPHLVGSALLSRSPAH